MGIWQSGVNTSLFTPLTKNILLKRRLGFKDNDFVCFYHGSLSNNRGVIQLVESFAIIKQNEKNIKLFILGKGKQGERSRRLSSKAGQGVAAARSPHQDLIASELLTFQQGQLTYGGSRYVSSTMGSPYDTEERRIPNSAHEISI